MALGAVVSVLAVGFQAKAWGPVAHEAVGLIAEDGLTPKTRQAVNNILSGRRLVDIATWPDAIRQSPEWKHTKTYHFTQMPDRGSYVQFVRDEPLEELAKGDVVRAILAAETILRARDSSKADRANALAFITHFIGDLHQPLHTGRREDRGGNDIQVHWFSRVSNLHQVWDSLIIDQKYGDMFNGSAEADYSLLYARQLMSSSTGHSTIGGLEDWVMESVSYRPQAYKGPIRDPERLTANSWEATDHLVRSAGERLAAMLNSIFDPATSARLARARFVGNTTLAQQLAQIQKLNGDVMYGVSLFPASSVRSRIAVQGISGAARSIPKTRLSNVLTSPRAPNDKRFWQTHGCDHSH